MFQLVLNVVVSIFTCLSDRQQCVKIGNVFGSQLCLWQMELFKNRCLALIYCHHIKPSADVCWGYLRRLSYFQKWISELSWKVKAEFNITHSWSFTVSSSCNAFLRDCIVLVYTSVLRVLKEVLSHDDLWHVFFIKLIEE